MSSKFSFDDNVNEKFEFTLGGLDYDFYYPTMDELQPMTDISDELTKLAGDTSEEAAEKRKELTDKSTEIMYSFMKPVGHDTPIKETLGKQSVKTVLAFNKKIGELLSE